MALMCCQELYGVGECLGLLDACEEQAITFLSRDQFISDGNDSEEMSLSSSCRPKFNSSSNGLWHFL